MTLNLRKLYRKISFVSYSKCSDSSRCFNSHFNLDPVLFDTTVSSFGIQRFADTNEGKSIFCHLKSDKADMRGSIPHILFMTKICPV